MASLSRRYRDGEHVEVWHALDTLTPNAGIAREDVEDVMRQTFKRVANNTDLLVGRLRDTGYRFESEAGRYGPAQAPHRQISVHLENVEDALEDRFGDLPAFAHGASFLPMSLHIFALVVGVIDLRQRHPAQIEEPDLALPSAARTPVAQALADALRDLNVAKETPETRALAAEDQRPHPNAQDPVLARLGDWNPLVVDLENLQDTADEREAEMVPMPAGGIGLIAELAPSFEQKADLPGGDGAHIFLPSLRLNPIVFEGNLTRPFITYLRTAFTQGGFLGVPAPVRGLAVETHTTNDGLLLPKHPILNSLAQDLVPF